MRRILPISFLAMAAPIAAMSAPCGVPLEARFVEGAPVDRFVITNTGASDLDVTEISLDLAPSKGRLIFDTVGGGAGVEVFQPFRSDAGTLAVADGAEMLSLPLAGLPSGAKVSFTIDVDDRLTASELGQIRVSGSEMQGAQMAFKVAGKGYTATFDAQNVARIAPTCGDNA